MNKKYVQIGTDNMNRENDIIATRVLNSDGHIDYSRPIEYFVADNADGNTIYRKVMLDPEIKKDNDSCSSEYKRLLEEAIQDHIKYDEELGYSTQLLKSRLNTLLFKVSIEPEKAIRRPKASCNPLYNSICIYSSVNPISVYHEVGHLKVSDAFVIGDEIIIQTGLMEERCLLSRPFFTEDGDEIFMTTFSKFTERGRGFEESLNEYEVKSILNGEDRGSSFGRILDLLLDGNSKSYRNNRDLNGFILELHKIEPPEVGVDGLLHDIDYFYNMMKDNSSFFMVGRNCERGVFEILSYYIKTKLSRMIDNGIYNESMLNNFLNWEPINENINNDLNEFYSDIYDHVEKVKNYKKI